MNEVQGITSVDSYMEALGLKAAGETLGLLQSVGIPYLLALGSVAFLFYRASERGGWNRPIVYFFQTAVWLALLEPVDVMLAGTKGTMRISTPRALFHTLDITDTVMTAASSNFLVMRKEMIRDRLSFAFLNLRIRDGETREAARLFFRKCLAPKLLQRVRDGISTSFDLVMPFNLEFVDPKEKECKGMKEALFGKIQQDLRSSSAVLNLLEDTASMTEGQALIRQIINARHGNPNISVDEYLVNAAMAREIGYEFNEMDRVANLTSAAATLQMDSKLLKEVGIFDRLTQGVANINFYALMLPNGLQAVVDAHGARFALMAHAPYAYGFALMLLLAGFPIAAVWGLLPGGWLALWNWGKVFLSVKLWPLFWNLMYVYTSSSEDLNSRLVIPYVYFAVPMVAFLFVNLLARSVSEPFRLREGSSAVSAGQLGNAAIMTA